MFADTEHPIEKPVMRRFSEGIEQLPETPEKNATRRFSEGIEQLPETPEKNATRRFSPGNGHPAPARHSRQARQAAV
jgi:hypothetical protein